MLDIVIEEAKKLLDGDRSGHGMDHTMRVYKIAGNIAKSEPTADAETVALAALLHDCDDYKLFGQECADNLTHAHEIMTKARIPENRQKAVCEIIHNMGYSKLLKGIRPKTIEGKIISDADMLDGIGALGIVRTISYSISKGNSLFEKDIFPRLNLTQEQYKSSDKKADNPINHLFEKLLKLKGYMLTTAGRAEAEKRHEIMVQFLRHFFSEQGLDDWSAFLEKYLKTI